MKPENADLLRCLAEACLEAWAKSGDEGLHHLGAALMRKLEEQGTLPQAGPLTRPEPPRNIKPGEEPDEQIPIRKGMANAIVTSGRRGPPRPRTQPPTKPAKPDDPA